MKRVIWAVLAAALFVAACLPACAEQTQVEVYVAAGAMERETAYRLVALAQTAYPQAEWSAVFEEDVGLSLRELVLGDRAPQIAICAPQEALSWAKEGLLLPLEGRVADVTLMEEAVVGACVWDETLYVAPLRANHRRVAVNGELLAGLRLNYLLDARTHPVWLPSELYQVIEEASLSGAPAMEVWLPQSDSAAGIEAFLQSLYGGELLTPEGVCGAGGTQILTALSWLRDVAEAGLVGIAQDRQSALEHFLSGETLLFIDWTDEEEALYAHELMMEGVDLREISYPTADAVVVRSFELTGAAVFAGHDAQAMRLAAQGVALWTEDTQAQLVLGDRGIWRDDAAWLPCLSAQPSGATLRSLFAGAVREVLAGGRGPQEALRQAVAVYEAATGR